MPQKFVAKKPGFSTKPQEDQFCPLDLLYFLWLQELSDQAGSEFENSDVRWVITVPAIWKQPAKQFMRQAAYQVSTGLGAGGGPRCTWCWPSPHSADPQHSEASSGGSERSPTARRSGAFSFISFLPGKDKGSDGQGEGLALVFFLALFISRSCCQGLSL